jgi:hypothetical protein
VQQLNYIADHDIEGVTLAAKERFFADSRQAYGRTALLLSGGGSLGEFACMPDYVAAGNTKRYHCSVLLLVSHFYVFNALQGWSTLALSSVSLNTSCCLL